MKPTYEELEAQVKQLAAERDAVVAENVALKAGASYFSYGSEHNFEWHKTAEEAVEAAEAAIDDYRGDACDGWSEEVDSVCWGIILQSSTKVGERPRTEDDCCDPAIDTICDYALLPNIETPATDAYAASLRAEGVEMFAAHCQKRHGEMLKTEPNEAVINEAITATRRAGEFALYYAAQLRSQSEQVKGVQS